MTAPRWLTWLTCTHDQWGTLARWAATTTMVLGVLLAIHYTIGVPR